MCPPFARSFETDGRITNRDQKSNTHYAVVAVDVSRGMEHRERVADIGPQRDRSGNYYGEYIDILSNILQRRMLKEGDGRFEWAQGCDEVMAEYRF